MNLAQTLASATSLDPQKRAEAMGMLEQWEREPSYHSTLLDIYFNEQNEVKIRSLAIISLKNGIKYWRKSAKFAISEAEKAIIRNRILQFREPMRSLSKQQAVAISKIARIDFPNQWPQLLDVILPAIEANPMQALFTLHLVMKELTSRSLPIAKKHTQELSPRIFSYLSQFFTLNFERVLSTISQPNIAVNVPETLELCRIALKSIRRIIINGYHSISEAPEVTSFLDILVQHLPRYLELSAQHSTPEIHRALDGIIIVVGKIFVDCSTLRVVDFVLCPSFPYVVDAYYNILQNTQLRDTVLDEKLKIQAMKILKNVVKHRDLTSHRPDPRIETAINIVENLMKTEIVISIAQLLLSKYLIISPADLQFWQDDPEQFVQEENTENWQYHLRGCAENLLINLVSKNRIILCPLILQTIGEVKDNLLMSEALYTVMAYCSHDLFDYVDFDNWIRTLAAGLKNMDKLLKRRVSNIIGNWVSVKCSDSTRPLLYEIATYLLREDEDIVVRLFAVQDVQKLVDDFDFKMDLFQPFLQPIVDLLMNLLSKVDEFDSRLNIINCLIVLIERMEGKFLPSVAPLVNILPELWMRSEGQNLFRTSIVTVITKLVTSLRGESPQLYPIVLPILAEALNVSQPGHLYLYEEGLELWLRTIQNAPKIDNLLDFLALGITFLENGTDSMKKILHILEAYVLVDPLQVLRSHASSIISAISKILENLSVGAINVVLQFIDLLLQACQANNCFKDLLQVLFVEGFFAKMMDIILGEGDLQPIVVGFMMITFRMSLYDPVATIAAMEAGGPEILSRYMRKCFDKFDALGSLKRRKLFSLSLASLVGTAHPQIISQMGEILAIFTSVAIDLGTLDRSQYNVLIRSLLFSFEPRDGDDDELSQFYQRKENLKNQDILFNENTLVPFTKMKFSECERILGSDQMALIMGKLDSDVILQYKKLVEK